MIISLREKFLAAKFGLLFKLLLYLCCYEEQLLKFSYFINSNKKYIQINKTSQSDKIFSKLTEFLNRKTHKHVTLSNHITELYSIRKTYHRKFNN